jgi:hypothetical protein
MFGGQIPFSLAGSPFNVATFGCPGPLLNIFTSSQIYTPLNKAYYSNCAEDDIIINLLFIAVGEFLIYKLFAIIGFMFSWCCNCKKIKHGVYYKFPFNTEMEAVNVFAFNIQLYVIIIFFPYVTVLAVLFLLIEFKFEFFKLTVLKGKPLQFQMKYESGVLLMRLFLITILIITATQILIYVSKLPHLKQLLVNLNH